MSQPQYNHSQGVTLILGWLNLGVINRGHYPELLKALVGQLPANELNPEVKNELLAACPTEKDIADVIRYLAQRLPA